MSTYDAIINGGLQVPQNNYGKIKALRDALGIQSPAPPAQNANVTDLSGQNQAVPQQEAAVSAPQAEGVPNSQTSVPKVNAPNLTAPATVQNPTGLQGEAPQSQPKTYEEMFRLLNPFKPMSEEELEQQRKRVRAQQKVSALADGISAIANLVATTKGASNAYTGENTLTGRQQARYDQLKGEYENNLKAYMSGLMGARQMDEQKADKERSWQRQLGLDKENRENRAEEMEFRREQAAIAQEQWDKQFSYKQKMDQLTQENWLKTFAENQRRANVSESQSWQRIKDARENNAAKIGAAAAKAARGKEIVFNDTKGNEMSIYENVWKGSMQQVFDALVEEMEANNVRVNRTQLKTQQAKDDFVKQHWNKYPTTVRMMNILAGLDPAEGIDGGIDLEQFAEGGDDDFSQFAEQ